MELKRRIIRKPYLRVIIWAISGLLMMGFGYVSFQNHFFLEPGHLSALHPKNEPINGFASHAEIESDCGHCHSPIHCVDDTKCQDCHHEIAKERAEYAGLHGNFPGVDQCELCHAEHKGRDAVITEFTYANLNHDKMFGFTLDNHQLDYDGSPLNCESCHGQDRFASSKLDCITCHVQGDHDYMATHLTSYGKDCVSCHDGADRMMEFRHADVFELEGGHEDAECDTCHADHVFAGTPSNCSECHEEPAVHAGTFGLNCARCHTAYAWAPAQLTEHVFVIDHGVEGRVTCETCHEHTYTEYPCYSCHEESEMSVGHEEYDIVAYENCVDCHPTGREGEADEFINFETGSISDGILAIQDQ